MINVRSIGRELYTTDQAALDALEDDYYALLEALAQSSHNVGQESVVTTHYSDIGPALVGQMDHNNGAHAISHSFESAHQKDRLLL